VLPTAIFGRGSTAPRRAGARKGLFPGTEWRFCSVRARKSQFPGTEWRFRGAGARKSQFPGTEWTEGTDFAEKFLSLYFAK